MAELANRGRRRAPLLAAGWAAALAAACFAGPASAHAEGTGAGAEAGALAAQLASAGTLRIALEGTYPPFNFRDPKSGQLTGYDVDVARVVATRLRRKPQFVLTEWSAILPALSAGRVDVAISQVVITPEREQAFDFSVPYTFSHFQLILRQNERATYRSLNDFKGRTLGVRQNSVFEQRAKAVGGIEVKSYPAVPENLQDLAFGRIDALLDDGLLVNYLVKHTELPLRAGPRVGQLERVGIAMRKGHPHLKEALDKALNEARSDGTLRSLSLKWFGVDASSLPPQP